MCIVIDVNSIPSVFSNKCRDHSDFLPVYRWLYDGAGFMVYGGAKYKKELFQMSDYRRIIKLFKDRGKIKEIREDSVNVKTKEIEAITVGQGCDDPHIVAIFVVSGCRLFCSKDARADKFIRNKKFYPAGWSLPSIYRKRNHHRLLNRKNIVSLKESIS